MKIKEAIEHYNSTVKEGEPKMNTRKLAVIILPNAKTIELAEQQMWHYSKGNRYHQITGTMVRLVCKTLKVDADFLFQEVNPDDGTHKELDINGMISIMKFTGRSPNKILSIKQMKK